MSNAIRFVFLSSVPLALLAAIGYLLAGAVGSFFALVFFGIFTFISYFFSEKIVLGMYHARPVDRDENKLYHDIAEKLAKKAGIDFPKLYTIETSTPTALVFGMKNASVAVTTGLLQLCDEREIEAVLSYEIAHIANKDVCLSTFSAIISAVVLYPFEMLWWKAVSAEGNGGSALRLPALFVAPLAAIITRPAMSGANGIAADISAAKISGRPKCLALALEKILREVKFRPLKFGSHATSHLFIMNPFNGTALSKFFAPRLTVKERIQRLEKMAV